MAQEMPEFQDFELLIGPARQPGVYPINITQSPAGRASDVVVLDPADPDLQSALHAIAERSTSEGLLIQLGRKLFKALMPDPIEDVYRRSQGTDKRLRVRLCIEPPELAALPWEFLYDPSADLSLAISKKHCLSRYLPVNEPVPTLQVTPPLRVLVVVSDPSDLGAYGMPALNAAEEIYRIKSAVQKLESVGQIKLEILPYAVGPDLRESLRTYSPHVIHLIGHGGFQNEQGVLIMEDENHKVRFVSDRQFREFFLETQDAKLVILNACQGATQSSTKALAGLAPQIVRRGLGAVIAMQYPIPDRVSLAFAREFYRAIVQYYPVDTAVAEGRRAVYQDFGSDRPDWGTPVMFMRSPDGRLFGPQVAPSEPITQKQEGTNITVIGAGANLTNAQVHIGDVGNINKSRGEVTEQQLRNAIIDRFSLGELKTLCADLRENLDTQLDFDSLEGEGKSGKARELVAYMRRRTILPQFIAYLRQNYPEMGL
jgi:hypothetical protein